MIKNTIFKKVKSLHSKSNSKYYKNNDPNNKTQLRKDISNQIFKNINDLCINENPNNFLTITIEKDYPENYNSESKQNSLNNNLNLSNKFQVKTKYIFIDKDKNLSPKTNLENKAHINYTQKKLVSKRLKGNLIRIKKNKCKNMKLKNSSQKIKKESKDNNKKNIKNKTNSHNSNKILYKIKENENSDIITNESLNSESYISKENEFIILKESHTENNINNKYKNHDMKLKGKKSLKKNKLIFNVEKEPPDNNNDNNNNNIFNNLKVMNYFKKLNKNENIKIKINDELNNCNINNNYSNNKNKNLKSNLSKNLLISDKKIQNRNNNENSEINNSNNMIKANNLNKKIHKKKVITENKEKNLINEKISTKKLIKKNIFKKKSQNYEMEENNQNISNMSINRNLFTKNEDNQMDNSHNKINFKKKDNKENNINNLYFALMKKKKFKEMKLENFSGSIRYNNMLLVSNNSEEILNINTLKLKERKMIKDKNSGYLNNYLNNQTNIENKTKNYKYFSKNIKNKIINNSTNNIHNLSNKDMIKIHKDSSQKKYSNNKHSYASKVINNRNQNNNKRLTQSIHLNLNDVKNNNMKRSISPNLNQNVFKKNGLNLDKLIEKQNSNNNNNNINIRYTANINNIFLNEIVIDLSKYTAEDFQDLINNNYLAFTSKNNHISPKNTNKSTNLFSAFYNKMDMDDKTENINNINNNLNWNSTMKNKRCTVNKNNYKIDVENILNTELYSNSNSNNNNLCIKNYKKKLNKDVNIHTLPNKQIKNINFDESLNDIQIPSIPEENIQIIPLKTIKYNQRNNNNFFTHMHRLMKEEKIITSILLYLNNKDLFNLSLANSLCYTMTIKLILKIIFYKIVNNINNKNLVDKLWNQELLKYSKFTKIKNFNTVYQKYLFSSNLYDKEIIKDLSRTFPNDSSFHKGSSSYKKLFNILKAYSNYNNEIGYAQGMNFIVAKLIKFFDNEKNSFIYLDSIFNKLNMEDVLGVSNVLEKKMKTVEFLLKNLCPDILFFLERKKINHEIFTAKWYITLFSKNFKFDNILKIIWNFSIIFGWKFIFLFSISVIISFKEKYINYDLYDFTQYMKNIFLFENFKNKFKDVMRLTFYYMSHWKNIIKNFDLNNGDNKEKNKNNKKNKNNVNVSEKEEEETDDIYQDNDEIIFNDDYAFT